MKGYNKFPFEERKQYEETFVENNSALIEELTGASRVFDISQTPMDKRSGVDAILQFDRGLSGVALRIRKPQYKKFSKRQKANKILTIVRKLTLSSFRLPSGLRTIDKRRRKENPLKKYNK